MSTVAANAFTDASGGNTATINTYAPGPGNMQGKNKFINGAFGIDQRNGGAAQTITAAAALAYTGDRWYAYCTGANVTGQRVAGTAPNQYNYQFTGAASVTKIGFAQRIEAANSLDLAGSTAVLSVQLANSLLTTVTWTAWYANTTDSFGPLAGLTRTQIATGTFTVTSTLTRYSTTISIPGAATTGIEVEFSVGAQTSGTWTIGTAQLEIGSVATPFERRLIGQELAFCQRYYETGGTNSVWSGNTTSGSAYSVTCRFAVVKRAAPTVTPTEFANSGFGAGDPTVSSTNTNQFWASKTSNLTVNGGYFQFFWNAVIEL